MKKKVGILGGTFNPPHLGHLIIANEVLSVLELDELRFMPNHEPPHKEKKGGVSDEDRIQMIQAAIGDHPKFKLELCEMQRSGKSYTYDTIKFLKEREPEADFYFIIGGDMIEYLPNWHRIDELCELLTFVGVKRPGYSTDTPYPVHMVEVPEINLSSSLLRERMESGETVRYLLPKKVIALIKEKRLYEPRTSTATRKRTNY
ncbi:MAG TPA: nicotinate-nucleotide adenylyltransferase [Chondromyces sp.]|nr:nicotinate-nucleotide adenylyltransferase [Chondromyces sp.]